MIGSVIGWDWFCGDGEPSILPSPPALTSSFDVPYQWSHTVSGPVRADSSEQLQGINTTGIPSTEALQTSLSVECSATSMLETIISTRASVEAGPVAVVMTSSSWADMLNALLPTASQADEAPEIITLSRAVWNQSLVIGQSISTPEQLASNMAGAFFSPFAESLRADQRVGGHWQWAMLPEWVFDTVGGGGGDPGGDHPGQSWKIAIQRVYIVSADVDLIRVSDNVRIQAQDIQLSLDWDKLHWDFAATVLGQQSIDDVTPSGDEPVLLQATINGYSWKIYVEDWEMTAEAKTRTRRITGRSISAMLTDPNYLPADYLSTENANAQQLALAALPYGWTLAWDTTDWLIPAGAWSESRVTPIQAVKRLAESVYAAVIPSRNSEILTVRSRYPVMPWDFATTIPDLVVPGTAATQVTLRQSRPGLANSIFIQGGLVGGVLVKATKEGTAGDMLLPTVQDNLITHVDAARARASGLLATQWQQPLIRSFAMPLRLGSFPLVDLGELIQINVGCLSTSAKGIANGVAVSAMAEQKGVKVRQHITLGEGTDNLWSRWNKNIPISPLIPGVVDSIRSDGALLINLTGGGQSVVRGTAGVGNHVYIRDGRIDGIVTSMSVTNIEI